MNKQNSSIKRRKKKRRNKKESKEICDEEKIERAVRFSIKMCQNHVRGSPQVAVQNADCSRSCTTLLVLALGIQINQNFDGRFPIIELACGFNPKAIKPNSAPGGKHVTPKHGARRSGAVT